MDELQDRLRALFVNHVKGLIENHEVKRRIGECELVLKEITYVSHLVTKPTSPALCNELREKKERVGAERELIEGRIKEFQSAMECLLYFLEENKVEDLACLSQYLSWMEALTGSDFTV